MKKKTLKQRTKKIEKMESIEENKESENVIKNNNYGITLIALVISVIVLLILARYLDFNVKSAIIPYLLKQEKPK